MGLVKKTTLGIVCNAREHEHVQVHIRVLHGSGTYLFRLKCFELTRVLIYMYIYIYI